MDRADIMEFASSIDRMAVLPNLRMSIRFRNGRWRPGDIDGQCKIVGPPGVPIVNPWNEQPKPARPGTGA